MDGCCEVRNVKKTEFEGAAHLAKKMRVSITKVPMEGLVASSYDCMVLIAGITAKMLYKKLNEAAKRFGTSCVLDSMIMDDEGDFRPGLKGRTEANVKVFYRQLVSAKRMYAFYLNI